MTEGDVSRVRRSLETRGIARPLLGRKTTSQSFSVILAAGTLVAALAFSNIGTQAAHAQVRNDNAQAGGSDAQYSAQYVAQSGNAGSDLYGSVSQEGDGSEVAPAPRRLRRPGNAQYSDGKPFQLNAERLHIQADENGHPSDKLQPLVPSAEAAFPPALNGRASQDTLHGRASAVPQIAPPRLQSQTASGDSAPFRLNANQNSLMNGTSKAPLQGNVAVQLLAQYDVELIVDESNSMRQRDCPMGLSRWEWCGMQARNLSNLLAPFVPRGLTLSTFASGYNVFENSKPSDIVELFAQPFFSGGTRLSRPLRDRLTSYFRNRKPGSKPMLIGVITDGVPVPRTEPALVAQSLIQASKQMKNPHEVTVVFFQIGGADWRGRSFLDAMDNQLVSYGAKYDFVQNVTFEQLQADGLALSLVKSIKNFAQNQTATR